MDIRTKKNENGDRVFIASGEESEFICSACAQPIVEGYMCTNNEKIILCAKCQENFPMSRCRHDVRNEHSHIKFKRNGST